MIITFVLITSNSTLKVFIKCLNCWFIQRNYIRKERSIPRELDETRIQTFSEIQNEGTLAKNIFLTGRVDDKLGPLHKHCICSFPFETYSDWKRNFYYKTFNRRNDVYPSRLRS